MNALPEKDRLEQIRRRHHEASSGWMLGVSNGCETLTARFIPADEPTMVATLAKDSSYADRDFLLSAHTDIAFLLGLVDRAIRAMRSIQRRQERDERAKDFAAEAAMKCAEPLFQKFIADRFGLEPPIDEKRVATRLRSILRVASRSELNSNPAAASAWRQLRSDFETWKRGYS